MCEILSIENTKGKAKQGKKTKIIGRESRKRVLLRHS